MRCECEILHVCRPLPPRLSNAPSNALSNALSNVPSNAPLNALPGDCGNDTCSVYPIVRRAVAGAGPEPFYFYVAKPKVHPLASLLNIPQCQATAQRGKSLNPTRIEEGGGEARGRGVMWVMGHCFAGWVYLPSWTAQPEHVAKGVHLIKQQSSMDPQMALHIVDQAFKRAWNRAEDALRHGLGMCLDMC